MPIPSKIRQRRVKKSLTVISLKHQRNINNRRAKTVSLRKNVMIRNSRKKKTIRYY